MVFSQSSSLTLWSIFFAIKIFAPALVADALSNQVESINIILHDKLIVESGSYKLFSNFNDIFKY